MLPAGAFGSGGTGYAERFGVRASDNCLLPTPLAHAVGALTVQSIALHKGNGREHRRPLQPARFWDQVAVHEQATFAGPVPRAAQPALELEAGAVRRPR